MAAATKPGSRAPASGPRSARKRWIALALLLLLTGAGIGVARYVRVRMHLSAVKSLQSELFSDAGRQLSNDERSQKMTALRSEMSALSADDRRSLRTEGMKRRTEEISRYFRLSPEERARYLDDLIARGERRRQEWQARRAADEGQQNAVSQTDSGRQRGPGTRGPLESASERDQRRENFLDSMPATQRTLWSEFRKELNARRQQLGLPAFGRP
jgi:hypothetical protein